MEEIDIALITKRSIHGVFALVSRSFFVSIITLIVYSLLGFYIKPEEWGIFYLVSAAIAFLSYFSDIGLAGALIQKKEEITQEDLRTTFTLQQSLVIIVVTIALLLSPFVKEFYHLPKDGLFLYQSLIVAFFLSSLKTIPSIILERELRFDKLVIPQIAETLVYNLTVLFFAVSGLGIMSFAYAVLARGIVGLIVIYLIKPWKISFGFSKSVAIKLLSFGIPFQSNSFLALIKDDLLIAYLGKVLPLADVGYIGFAQKWAFTPLRLIMDNVIRVTFPAFSRLQHDKELLSKAIEKSLFAASFFIFPAVAGLVIMAPYFIHLIPKYSKWQPALISLGFFSLNAALSSISTPLTNALNAIGKIKTTLYLMIFWTAATWILTPFCMALFGFNGVSIASALIGVSVVYVVFIMNKYVTFSASKALWSPALATGIMSINLFVFSQFFISNIITLGLTILFGGLIYFVSIYLLAKRDILENIALIRKNLKK